MTDKTPPWRPLLPPGLAERALETVQEIARDLASWPAVPRWPGTGDAVCLASGLAGRALFFAYLEEACPGEGHGDLAVEMLERAIDGLSGLRVGAGLFSGFTGVAWVLEHLQGRFLEAGDEDPGEEIAAGVRQTLSLSPWRGEHDLVGGLVGLGVYALERRPRSHAEESLRLAVERLAGLAERAEDGGLVWRTPFERVPADRLALFPQGYVGLGVAHGMAGVIAFLAAAGEAGVREAHPLLASAVPWLLARQLPVNARAMAVFPFEVAPGCEPRPSTPGWCWGDPGTLAALLGAARRAGQPAWEREAVALGIAAARHQTALAGHTHVHDASLCHGSAGLGHLFNRLFQATGEPAFAAAALRGFDRTFELRRPGEGVGGFLAWENDEHLRIGWRAEPGFLTGAAGVGLALLAAATSVEPEWDRVLLVSIPSSAS